MKKLLVILLALSPISVSAQNANGSNPYFQVIGFGAPIKQSVSTLLDPNQVKENVAVTDIALITHSSTAGTIMPSFCRDTWCPPESWSPLAIGGGADASGNKVINIDSTVNLSPQLAALILLKVTSSSPAWLRVIKDSMMGNSPVNLRIGWGELGYATKNGVFQSAKEAFPGAGAVEILKNAGRIDVGLAWTY